MEAVGAVASILGVATVALQLVKALNDDIDAIKNAPDTLRKISTDLKALTPVLQTLEDAANSDPQSLQRFRPILPAVQSCADTCKDFHTQLNAWSRQSSTDNISRFSSAKFGLFGQKRLQGLRLQISNCKETLTVVLMATHFIDPTYGVNYQVLLQKLADIDSNMQQQVSTLEQMSPDPENAETQKALLEETRRNLASNEAIKVELAHVVASLPQREPDDAKVRTWSERLQFTDPATDRQNLINTMGQRVDDTCEWISQNSAYQAWLAGQSPFLWLRGNTGKGKTMLSIYLSDSLVAHTARPNTHLIYYFCRKQDEKHNTATAVLRVLLWQLTRKPSLTKCIAKHLEQHGEPLLSDQKALWKIFASLVHDTECGTIYCVLDGLDEIVESSLWLAKKFLSLFSPGAREPHLNVLRLLLVSQNIAEFQLRGQSSSLCLEDDVQSDVDQDVGRVIDSKLATVPDWNGFSDDYRQKVREGVLRKSNGSFVPIGIIMNAILVDRPYSGLLETIDSLPEGLEALYANALLGIQGDKRSEAPEVLRWVAMALRPLTVEELANAVSDQATSNLDESAVRATVQRCSAVLKIHDDVVVFSHQSARDYLLPSAGEGLAASDQLDDQQKEMVDSLRIEPQEAHLEIALKCLQLIKESHLQHRILDSPTDWDKAPLLKYAVVYWPHHAQAAGEVGKKLFTSTSFVLSTESRLTHNWWKTYVHERRGEEWEQGEELSPLHIACRFGIVEWVRSLLNEQEQGGSLKKVIDAYDVNGASPLAWAAMGGHSDVVDLLLSHGANIELLTALRSGGSRDQFSGRTAQSYTREMLDSNGMFTGRHTILYRAAFKGHADVVKLLLDRGANVYAHGCARSSAVHAAAISGNVEVLGHLLDYGGNKDIDAELKTVMTTPLHYAVENGNYEVAKILLNRGADIRKRQKYSMATVLHFASWKAADPAVVELLLEKGAEVNVRDSHYRRPLHLFVQRHGRPEAVRLILDAGAKIDGLNSLRQNALDIAIDCDCDRCMGSTQVLLEYGACLKNPYGNGRKNHPELFEAPEKSWEPLSKLKAASSLGSEESLPTSSVAIDSELASLDDASSLAGESSLMERLSVSHVDLLRTPATEATSVSANDSKVEEPLSLTKSETSSLSHRASIVSDSAKGSNAKGLGLRLDEPPPGEEASVAGESVGGSTASEPLRKRDRFRAKMQRLRSG